ncbi:8-amino-7-oxononanoate synthase [Paenibacillus sp. N1-5-1-14]|uniref:8-amino-7-oxononanoate synthase n=1 Tax=Paenibacillus radicibacter TaxID=2972488 RepID=UPI002159498F|nr:8-amino-7-oxononanoate synthase [Paenibacillus radicibacter]MCR8642053.1 8-amino-7-oxononanoate synthase [Paenibacillus radicibacter]
MSRVWEQSLQEELEGFHKAGLHRKLTAVGQGASPYLNWQGQRMLNLSSNNYLGLADHPMIIEAQIAAARVGAGSGASRLVVGHDLRVQELEDAIATFKHTEAALVMASGYMANLGVLSSMLGSSDAVFSDRLNHASIVDGIRLSGAKHYRYRHNDMNHLETLLRKADEQGIRKKLIVTDTVFSMDGDVANLHEIVKLKEKYDAALMVDEAHAGGVFGPCGEGMCEEVGVAEHVDIHMGTFSKAFGSYGAYIAGKRVWIDYLVNTCRSLIYTTALPPAVIGGIQGSLTLVQEANTLRSNLHAKSDYFRSALQVNGFDTCGSTTPIIPILIGDEGTALAFSKKLAEQHIRAVAIRPPTVPSNTSRIRFTIMANHDQAALEQAAEKIVSIGKELGVIGHG